MDLTPLLTPLLPPLLDPFTPLDLMRPVHLQLLIMILHAAIIATGRKTVDFKSGTIMDPQVCSTELDIVQHIVLI